MNENLSKAFLVFEVIISIVIINLLLVFLSVISFGILFPVTLTSIMYTIQRVVVYKDYQGMIYSFFKFIKGNITRTLKVLAPVIIGVILLLLNLFAFNNVLEEFLPTLLVQFIFYIQLFVLYYLIGFLLHTSILLASTKEANLKEIYFIIFQRMNLNPIRNFFGIFAFFMVIFLSLFRVDYFYLILFPIALIAFYITVLPLIEDDFKKDKIE